jgi:hypothetical protein
LLEGIEHFAGRGRIGDCNLSTHKDLVCQAPQVPETWEVSRFANYFICRKISRWLRST